MSGWRCAGLAYRYPDAATPAVLDLSLRISAGATTAVLGPNGSGKSTLLRLLLGVVPPSAGSVDFQDRPQPALGLKHRPKTRPLQQRQNPRRDSTAKINPARGQ